MIKPGAANPSTASSPAAPAGPARASNVVPIRGWATPRHTADERAFLPAAMELVETPLSPTIRLTAAMICGLIVIAVGWSILARIDTVAVAPGKVVPLGQVKVVQPLETSAISAIHVDDGDHVMAGQLLVDLDPTDLHADLQSMLYDRGQAALDAEVARLMLTMDPDAAFAAITGVDPVLAEANHAQAISEVRKFLAQVAETRSDVDQKTAILESNAAFIERARATLICLWEQGPLASQPLSLVCRHLPVSREEFQWLIKRRSEGTRPFRLVPVKRYR